MKRSLPLIIIGVVLVGAVGLTWFLLRKKAGPAEPTTNLAATEKSSLAAVTNSTSPTAASSEAPLTKPNVKVSSPVALEEYGDQQHGASIGVTGTPTVFIDGHMLRAEATNPDGVRRGINVMMEKKAVS